MSASLESEFREDCAQHLSNLSHQLVAALHIILSNPATSTAAALRFEFESPHFDSGFPVMYWFVDDAGRPVAVKKLLPEVKHAIPESVIYGAAYESAGLDTWSLASEVFVRWFADCWKQADGEKFQAPAYLAHHDSIFSFDLTKRIQVRNETVA